MAEILRHIDAKSESLLSSLIGQQIILKTQSVSLDGDYLLLDDIWILGEDRNGIYITEEWYDTDACALDVFELKISEKKKPLNSNKQKDEYAKFCSTVGTQWPNKVEEIHIIECYESDEIIEGENKGYKDIVKFDGGLAFDMSNGQCFKIGLEASIAGRFTFEYIKSHSFYSQLREWRVRKTLTSTTIH